jgi:hypothetical protein
MNWWQTLTIAVGPALVTAVSLTWQNVHTKKVAAEEGREERNAERARALREERRAAHLAMLEALLPFWEHLAWAVGEARMGGPADQEVTLSRDMERPIPDAAQFYRAYDTLVLVAGRETAALAWRVHEALMHIGQVVERCSPVSAHPEGRPTRATVEAAAGDFQSARRAYVAAVRVELGIDPAEAPLPLQHIDT